MGPMDASVLDAVVVGAGPNGLAAAVALARAGYSVGVLEGSPKLGGGCRTAELTLPGFRHDVCAAVHPIGRASPFLNRLPLGEHGLEWLHPELPLAHPFDDGSAAVLRRDLGETAAGLGEDGARYEELFGPIVSDWPQLLPEILGPLRVPRHPLVMARFGLPALRSVAGLCRGQFKGPHARALLAGISAHALVPLDGPATASFGLVMGAAGHVSGWPVARGGSQAIVESLASLLRSLGGWLETGRPVRSLRDVPPSRVVLFDLTPRQVLAICGDQLPAGYRERLGAYRYGPGSFKIDYALSGPIPWTAEPCRRAGTVHLGATLEEMIESERAIHEGRVSGRPYVLVAQQSLVDPSRAPAGQHTAWVYCHVPHGSDIDMTAAVEAQLERFAPGFRDLVLARSARGPRELERYNENNIGGDINGGQQDLGQLFTRPVARSDPYATPNPRLFFCSSSTPPGGGVHGMCGYFAALSAIARLGGEPPAPL